jgi:hypothetical protein
MMRPLHMSWVLASLAGIPNVSAVPAVKVGMNAAFDAGPYLLELVYSLSDLLHSKQH